MPDCVNNGYVLIEAVLTYKCYQCGFHIATRVTYIVESPQSSHFHNELLDNKNGIVTRERINTHRFMKHVPVTLKLNRSTALTSIANPESSSLVDLTICVGRKYAVDYMRLVHGRL